MSEWVMMVMNRNISNNNNEICTSVPSHQSKRSSAGWKPTKVSRAVKGNLETRNSYVFFLFVYQAGERIVNFRCFASQKIARWKCILYCATFKMKNSTRPKNKTKNELVRKCVNMEILRVSIVYSGDFIKYLFFDVWARKILPSNPKDII